MLSASPKFDFISTISNTVEDDSFLNCNDSPYYGVNFNCRYSNINSCRITDEQKELLVLSVNIQSLTAKFCELKELLFDLSKSNIVPDIICLQELWHFPQNANFTINNYHPLIYKLRENTQGGVSAYLLEKI